MASLNDTVIKGKLIADDLGTLIREVVLTENTKTIQFTNLDIKKDGGTYELVMHLKTNREEKNSEWCLLNINGTTGGYQKVITGYGNVYVDGSPSGGFGCGILKSYRTCIFTTIHCGFNKDGGYGEIDISSNSMSNDAESSYIMYTTGFYFNPVNITSIEITPQTNTFGAGSIVRLYKRR